MDERKTNGKSTDDKSGVMTTCVDGVEYEFEQFIPPQRRRGKKTDAK